MKIYAQKVEGYPFIPTALQKGKESGMWAACEKKDFQKQIVLYRHFYVSLDRKEESEEIRVE